MTFKILTWLYRMANCFLQYIWNINQKIDKFIEKNYRLLTFLMFSVNIICALDGTPPMLPSLWREQLICFATVPLGIMCVAQLREIEFVNFYATGIIIFVCLPLAYFLTWFFSEGIHLLMLPAGYRKIPWWQIPVGIMWNRHMYTLYTICTQDLMEF